MRVALGFRPHSSWTVVVAVGDVRAPVVVDRRRLECGDPTVPEQVYHAARGRDIDAAARLVARAEQVVGRTVSRGVRDLVADLRARDHHVVAAGVPTSSAVVPERLATILASHTLLHAAEGDLVRKTLVDSVNAQGLSVYQAPTRDLAAGARARFGHDGPALDRLLVELGRALGSPWRRDEKDATLVAWLALEDRGPEVSPGC